MANANASKLASHAMGSGGVNQWGKIIGNVMERRNLRHFVVDPAIITC